VPPDSVWCTRVDRLQLFTFGCLDSSSAIIHRTVRCATGQCLVHQGRSTPTLHLRVFGQQLRYNSPDCPVCQRSNSSQAQRSTPTVAYNVNSARTVRAESEQRQKAHRTVNSACPMRHRTIRWPRLSELQWSKPSEP
jgi:hypothetical protein